MLFNSTLYLVFLPLVAVLFHASSPRARRWLLLIASYAFYWVWSIPFSLLLLLSTVVDHAASLVIDGTRHRAVRRAALGVSLLANLGVLATFKYADFFAESIESLTGQRPWPILGLVLPLGISFYTFQTMSYTIDVYRGHMRARRSLMDVALYVSFFPQLVAGPIIRADTLVPQLRVADAVDWILIRGGIGMILWGMLKKVYFADAMAPVVNEAFSNPAAVSGLSLLAATYAFSVQIYCDFSGYSDIAIGSALVLGVRLPENFRSPYLSCSIREFWRRWHISLSTWLRDYLYIPLGGGRKGIPRTYANLMITMLLGGLWHGAGWNWVVWGGLQGGLMIAERLMGVSEQRPSGMLRTIIRWTITFHLVCLSWIFFRSADLGQALEVIARIGTMEEGLRISIVMPGIALAALLTAEIARIRSAWIGRFEHSADLAFWACVIAIPILALTFVAAPSSEFIYFQF
ncbi:MAG: MBOAT family O-acyltransferase [Planctomycetota bacterium]|jgi:D-alanyl-lipoteichoic acid acyltransferase DltB (MBOAT superfamily)